jgi:hypothetical protein
MVCAQRAPSNDIAIPSTEEPMDYTEDHGHTVDDLKAEVESLLREDWSSLDDEPAVERLGRLIDAAHETDREDAARTAIGRANALLGRQLAPVVRTTVHYFLANAWSAVACGARGHQGTDPWDAPEAAHQIVHLRHAFQGGHGGGRSPEARDERLRYCRIATNLGNLMSQCGRIVDAIAYWDAALRVDPGFTMALGNRGHGLLQYAGVVHDPGHREHHLRAAYADLVLATDGRHAPRAHPGARRLFEEALAYVRARVPDTVLEHPAHEFRFPKRMTKRERVYRQWCLERRLFLNDLNDVGAGPLAAADVLMLPDLVTPFDSGPPNAIGFFNQLKQEYVSARFLYYQGVTSTEPHFSDREVTLVNTLDYPAYGFAVEQVKAAFRIAYSLFDKIAFFLNDYLILGIPERQVNFRTLWYDRQDAHRGLRADLPRENGLLKGLYWLGKDLHEAAASYVEALEPHAREMAAVRNHLEHKYLKLHVMGPLPSPKEGETRTRGEELAFSLARISFEDRTLELLSMARSALITLSLAVYVEEHRREREAGGNVLTMPVFTDVWEDDWKV